MSVAYICRPKKALPSFVAPMLAKPGQAFDSAEHLFEIKWDGSRTLAFIDRDRYRLVNRHRAHMTERYPEFEFLAQLPPGTILDGETVVLEKGKPNFYSLLAREQARAPLKIRMLARSLPATFIAFDLLYEGYVPILAETLQRRRERLQNLVQKHPHPALVLSEGIVGDGVALFSEACRRGLEGIVAKRLQSRYRPGKRADAWTKVKRQAWTLCAIIGFVRSGKSDFGSLILATETEGHLRTVGTVSSGFDSALRSRLNRLLWSRLCEKPLVASKIRGTWVEPGLFCKVSFLERTPSGDFRAPVFQELYGE